MGELGWWLVSNDFCIMSNEDFRLACSHDGFFFHLFNTNRRWSSVCLGPYTDLGAAMPTPTRAILDLFGWTRILDPRQQPEIHVHGHQRG